MARRPGTEEAPPRPRGDRDRVIHQLAAGQHGIVARRQLLASGLSGKVVERRLRREQLHVVFDGSRIYRVGVLPLSREALWTAAVLSQGPGSVLSHRSAAALWGLLDGRPHPVEVLTARTPTALAGLAPRRARPLADHERSVRHGIPCTSPARTLRDLATVVSEHVLDEALRRAVDRRCFDREAIELVLGSGRPGSAALRAALTVVSADHAAGRVLKSQLEVRFLALLRRNGLPLPQTNVEVMTPWKSYEVDVRWPGLPLVLEIDGWRAHRDRRTFRRDHRRDADLAAAGYRPLRLDADQIDRDERGTVERLHALGVRPTQA